MAGHASSSDRPPTKGEGFDRPNQRISRRRKARRETFSEVMAIAHDLEFSVARGTSTNDALQECLDRVVALFRAAAAHVDELDDDELFEMQPGPGGSVITIPNRWITLETEMRKEVEALATRMTSLGIAERKVRVEEAQALLMVAAIRDAALSIGMPHDQVRLLGAALRDRLDASHAELSPDPNHPRSSALRLSQSASTHQRAQS